MKARVYGLFLGWAICLPSWVHAQSAKPSVAIQSGGGWNALPAIFGQALAVTIYARAVEWIWWLVGATVLSWAFHLLIGRKAGLTQPDPVVNRRNPWRKERDSERLRWLLPFIHLPLTVVTVLALLLIWSGNRAGLEFREKAERWSWKDHVAPNIGPLNQAWAELEPRYRPWPTSSGYMPSRPIDANRGQGAVKIDNTRGSQDVYAKLCTSSTGPTNNIKNPGCYVQRQVYIRKGETFQLESLSTGGYEVKFIEVQSGKAMITPYFEIPHGEPSFRELKLFDTPGQAPLRKVPSTDF